LHSFVATMVPTCMMITPQKTSRSLLRERRLLPNNKAPRVVHIIMYLSSHLDHSTRMTDSEVYLLSSI
jgi:hypothetical protein